MTAQGRVALITGGAAGIGWATANFFAARGATVVVNDINPDPANACVREIQAKGGSAIPAICDVGDDSEVRTMFDNIIKSLGRVDYLINNAGWSRVVPHAALEELSDIDWERTHAINVRAPFYCARAAATHLRAHDGTAIVNVASMAGVGGRGSSIAYAASKAAVLLMTKSLARVLAPVRVNAVAPGVVRTGFAGWKEDHYSAVERVTPLRRLATVEDVASAIYYLAVEAKAITAEIMQIDGGLTMIGRS